jgi:hypothetical protein
MSDERILEKIKKCLAMASSPNPNEAEIAWRQARKLMETHHLDMRDIEASEANIAKRAAGKRPPVWMLSLAQACAKAFSCRVITESSISGSKVVFIGVGNSPLFCEYAFIALQNQLVIARKNYVGTLSRCKLATKRRRGEIFAENWVDGVLANVMRFAQADDTAEKAIKAYFDKNLPAIPTRELEAKKVLKRDSSAANAGYTAGQNTKLHKAVNQDNRVRLNFFH